MKRFMKVVLVEWKLNNRNFLNLFFALVFPVMMLMLFGTMYGNEPTEFMGGFGGVDASVPGYICMIIAVTGLMTLPLTLSQYRERKILKRFMITPVKPIELLVSQLVVNTITTVIGMIILLIVGKIVFDLHFFGNILSAIISFFIILLSIFSIGLLVAGLSKNVKVATAISYIIYFPMLFLSGATMPLEAMPESIVNISKALPLTYGVRLFKGVWLGNDFFDYTGEIFILLGIIVIFSLLATRFFKWE
ncbi:ABC transporter permease [Sporosalibacterium faouarense]|uniref:ABC transporter permease n=1 Tax=Sporosalibacterium faouarense TaxID=516123 RepID=UPI00192B6D0E|nr:ABC transporter permease [Sporosalibacterium faouarense]